MRAYEQSSFQTIGGTGTGGHQGNGQYQIVNPWGGVPCEVKLINITADGAGTALFVQGDPQVLPSGNINDEWMGLPINFTAAGMTHPGDEWTPCEGTCYWVVSGNSHLYLSVIWRRLLPDARVMDSFPAADRALQAVAANNRANTTTRHNRWGNGEWANVKNGTVAKPPKDYRDHPGSQGSRVATRLAFDPEKGTPGQKREDRIQAILQKLRSNR